MGLIVSDRTDRRTLFSAVFVALALRVVVACFVYKRFLNPTHGHMIFGWEIGQVAHSIVTGRGFANPYWVESGPTTLLTPVFPYLFAMVFIVFGAFTKASALAILGLNSLFSALTCVPVFLIARRDYGSKTAHLGLWAWVFLPYAVYFSANSMWYNSLVGLLLALIFLAAQRLESSDRMWKWAGLGVLFGFTALTNPVVLAIFPFLAGWLCHQRARQHRDWVWAATVCVVGLMATIAPWLIRNYRTFHRPVFLKDNFWMEICVGNINPAPDFWNSDIHPSDIPSEMAEFQNLGELGYMAEKRREALALLRAEPGIFLARSLRRTVYVWTGLWTLYKPYMRQIPLYIANILILTPLTLLSFWGLYTAFRAFPERAVPYFLVLLTFPAVYYFTHADPRYRHPIDPLLVILASYAIAARYPLRRGMSSEEKAALGQNFANLHSGAPRVPNDSGVAS